MPASPRPISNRELNRAVLARQSLLKRERRAPLDIVRLLGGIQAQNGNASYVSLWNRIEGFRVADLEALFESRAVVRANVQRGTIHLLTAEDYLAWQPLLLPTLKRMAKGNFGRFLTGVDFADIAGEAKKLLTREPLTNADLGRALQKRWPDRDRLALAIVGRSLNPTIHQPPSGLWNKGAAPRFVLAKSWLGRNPKAGRADDMVLRYLAAFGPASVMDAQMWSGVPRLAPVFERLRKKLVTFTAESGRELFDLPDAPRPGADTPAPHRLLADYENLGLGYADRTRFGSDLSLTGLAPDPRYFVAAMTADGVFVGFWRLDARAKEPEIALRPTPGIRKADLRALKAEGERLLSGLCAGKGRITVIS